MCPNPKSKIENPKLNEWMLEHRPDVKYARQVFLNYGEGLLGSIGKADEFQILF